MFPCYAVLPLHFCFEFHSPRAPVLVAHLRLPLRRFVAKEEGCARFQRPAACDTRFPVAVKLMCICEARAVTFRASCIVALVLGLPLLPLGYECGVCRGLAGSGVATRLAILGVVIGSHHGNSSMSSGPSSTGGGSNSGAGGGGRNSRWNSSISS